MSDVLNGVITWLGSSSGGIPPALMWPCVVLMFLIARKLEQIRPIERHDSDAARAEIAMDYKLAALNYTVNLLLTPVYFVCAATIISALGGGGLINLKPDTWTEWVAVLLFYIVMLDIYKYWLHRLSHTIPALWALHSFHHSAESLTIVTGARHHWLDRGIATAFFPFMDVVFSIPPGMAFIIGMIFVIPDGLSHLNYRVTFGRFVVVLNNAQWHRIHHSTKPEHINKNYAALFPLMDFIFGTAVIPAEDEYPSTGMVPSERPDLVDGFFWPFRRYVRLVRARNRPENVNTGI